MNINPHLRKIINNYIEYKYPYIDELKSRTEEINELLKFVRYCPHGYQNR